MTWGHQAYMVHMHTCRHSHIYTKVGVVVHTHFYSQHQGGRSRLISEFVTSLVYIASFRTARLLLEILSKKNNKKQSISWWSLYPDYILRCSGYTKFNRKILISLFKYGSNKAKMTWECSWAGRMLIQNAKKSIIQMWWCTPITLALWREAQVGDQKCNTDTLASLWLCTWCFRFWEQVMAECLS